MTIWPSFARKRVRRPRPSTSTCSQYIFCAGRCKRAPLRSRACLLHPQRPRAAASCGAAAAGQETSRSPAQGGRRPPAVSLAETESHAAGQATERGRRTGHCSLHRPPVPPCHSCRSQDESRQIFEIRGSFGQILRLNRCESQPLPHTFTTPLCLYHSKPCLLPSGKFLIFFFALKKQGIHEEYCADLVNIMMPR